MISPARKIAFGVLRRVEDEGAYASDLLHAELAANVKAEDAALATELAMGVLRWRGLLDFLLERLLEKPVARLDLAVALALRIGIYQLRFLQRIPARAAVNESVELVKRSGKTSAASLVNAVLRRASREAAVPADEVIPAGLPLAERLGILHSHPKWLVERWLSRFGEADTVALLDANNRTPRLACAVLKPGARCETIGEWTNAGMSVRDGRLLKDAFSVSGGSPTRTEAFRAGKISVQDEASQAVPLLLDVHPGDRVLDLCAAPGGKTVPLARAAGARGSVVAADVHAHRLRAMRAQFDRVGFSGIGAVELDAAKALPFLARFQRILVDAPCSGTGTLARHPEIRWRLRPEQLAEFHRMQVEILGNAMAGLAPGGSLAYSTCSLEPEENEEVVAQALRNTAGIRRVTKAEIAPLLEPHLASSAKTADLLDDAGQFRTFPGKQETDGFFAAVLKRE